ncbi:MAG: type II secretion system protein N [Gammaproteobacteria bacterium]|nr:type II secretion system protein N [Gammaproteobacteria bacterium]
MKRNYIFALSGAATFILSLLILAPAKLIQGTLSDNNIRATGIQGSLWSGQIQTMSVQGWQLSETEWTMNPLTLLLGRVSADIKTRYPGGTAAGGLSLSLGGRLSLVNFDAEGNLSPLSNLLQLPLSGRYQAQVETAEFKDAWPEVLVAEATVTGVLLDITGNPDAPRGDYSIQFNHDPVGDDQMLNGLIKDEGGPLDIVGQAILTPPASYELQLKVAARPEAPKDLLQALQFAGPVDAEGRREVALTGSL